MRKLFQHNFVQPIELNTQNINGQRHYVMPNGDAFKSVTTILGEKMDKTALLEWKARVGEEEAQRISTQAARRGTSIHSIAERYVLNEDNFYRNEMPSNVESFKALKEILDANVDNIYGVELPLFSRALRAAGRTDLVAQYNGVNSIIDFKTSRRLKKEEWITSYFYQSTVYSMMFEWMYKVPVPQIVIMISVDHEDPQVFVKQRNQYVGEVLNLFDSF